MSRRRRPSLFVLATSCGLLACSGSTPKDVNYGTDAGADYGLHAPEVQPDTTLGCAGGTGVAGTTVTSSCGGSGGAGTGAAGMGAAGTGSAGTGAAGTGAAGTGAAGTGAAGTGTAGTSTNATDASNTSDAADGSTDG